ncbi:MULTISPECIES: ImmA/IrrE family metallo-endopeptidase [unclassified Halomonas]|uniref:ImmA/IrrE family metallo-endopeptidase n=1 Tax=unclassified Halomonas TaxID=2609666 RepID=UPI0020769D3E|nr:MULTISPECIES: ImmA/IrrE family metallo-endopeptidase [unclassified Halomonas]
MKYSPEWNQLPNDKRFIIENLQTTLPVKLGVIAKEFGLEVKTATLPPNISGEIKEKDGRIFIRVNRHDVKARQRFTLAHEIAHFLLHRHLLKDGIQDDALYRSKQSDKVEAEANRLAADILMPLKASLELIKEKSDLFKGDILYEEVANEMGVSTTALKIRLGKI